MIIHVDWLITWYHILFLNPFIVKITDYKHWHWRLLAPWLHVSLQNASPHFYFLLFLWANVTSILIRDEQVKNMKDPVYSWQYDLIYLAVVIWWTVLWCNWGHAHLSGIVLWWLVFPSWPSIPTYTSFQYLTQSKSILLLDISKKNLVFFILFLPALVRWKWASQTQSKSRSGGRVELSGLPDTDRIYSYQEGGVPTLEESHSLYPLEDKTRRGSSGQSEWWNLRCA